MLKAQIFQSSHEHMVNQRILGDKNYKIIFGAYIFLGNTIFRLSLELLTSFGNTSFWPKSERQVMCCQPKIIGSYQKILSPHVPLKQLMTPKQTAITPHSIRMKSLLRLP